VEIGAYTDPVLIVLVTKFVTVKFVNKPLPIVELIAETVPELIFVNTLFPIVELVAEIVLVVKFVNTTFGIVAVVATIPVANKLVVVIPVTFIVLELIFVDTKLLIVEIGVYTDPVLTEFVTKFVTVKFVNKPLPIVELVADTVLELIFV
jgi:hypothetical protein